MTQEQFEKLREKCPQCKVVIERSPNGKRTFTCTHEGSSFNRECCEEICPKIFREPCIEAKKESINPVLADDTYNTVDIHKIIDDAMEKKDRRVSIFMTECGVTIEVEPIVETKKCWIPIPHRRTYIYRCPDCGVINKEMVPYCPYCGEKLAVPGEEYFNTMTNTHDVLDDLANTNYIQGVIDKARENNSSEMPQV